MSLSAAITARELLARAEAAELARDTSDANVIALEIALSRSRQREARLREALEKITSLRDRYGLPSANKFVWPQTLFDKIDLLLSEGAPDDVA